MTAIVPARREEEFLASDRELTSAEKPNGLLRSELLRGNNDRWLIQTLWRDRTALMASRQPGSSLPALALLDRLRLNMRMKC